MPTPRSIQRTYLILMLGNTLAASFIWGINTIFLLDAGLSNAEAFAANAFFTAGMMLFEIPTGWWGDRIGTRRVLTRIVIWWSSFTIFTAGAFNYASLLVTRFAPTDKDIHMLPYDSPRKTKLLGRTFNLLWGRGKRD